jgi:phage host-nuclease inhibitor protein Gam
MGLAAENIRHRGDMGGIADIEDLDQVIKLIGLHDIHLDQINIDMELAIKTAKNEALTRAAAVRMQRDNLLALAETYMSAHREEVLKKAKSKTFNFGKIGWRKSPDAITLPKKGSDDMEALCNRIQEQQEAEIGIPPDDRMWGDVSIRTLRYVLKSDLGSIEDQALDMIGVKYAPGNDVFFVQPDREKLAEMENPARRCGSIAGLEAQPTE